jgi:AAA+ ATPase superfamily predicted ATPase
MFFGRKAELNKLNEMYGSNKFEFAIIYGRRRVGKTTLIREFIKGKNSIFFTANESTASENLSSLSRGIGGKNTSPVYLEYESALTALFNMSDNERFIFVIDEFPYLAESYRGISSLLQILIDNRKENSKMFLILCGSSMSFMENQVLGYQSPLYGRRTAQFKVLPFTFFESLPFFTGYSSVDKAVLYGVTGGVPEYLNKIDKSKNVRKNITDLFLTPSGHFFEEPTNLIKQELREPSTYNVIIEAIAHGASRLNEIATKSGIEANKSIKYLTSLISLGLVSKEHPYGETAGRRSIYKLEDKMFRFWYRFVFPNISAITMGLGEMIYENDVKAQLNAYMGLVFEDICKHWFYEQAKRNALPFFAGNFGRWWGTDSKSHGQEEIDIAATRDDNAIFAECKWTNSYVGIEVYNELMRKSKILKYKKNYLFMFAKSGFTDAVYNVKHEDIEDRLYLITLDRMVKSHTDI